MSKCCECLVCTKTGWLVCTKYKEISSTELVFSVALHFRVAQLASSRVRLGLLLDRKLGNKLLRLGIVIKRHVPINGNIVQHAASDSNPEIF